MKDRGDVCICAILSFKKDGAKIKFVKIERAKN